MTQKDKKQKGKREDTKTCHRTGHRTGTILELIKLEYIAKILCWCGNTLIIDSRKSLEENVCPVCGSPYKLIDNEWTESEMKKFISLKELT